MDRTANKTVASTIAQMLSEWDAATPAQRDAALAAVAAAAAAADRRLRRAAAERDEARALRQVETQRAPADDAVEARMRRWHSPWR